MAVIPVQGTGLRHVRKTINFDGSANNGNLGGTIPVFALTGRVFVRWCVGYISDPLVCAAPSDTELWLGVGGGAALGQWAVDGLQTNMVLSPAGSSETVLAYDPTGDAQGWICADNIVGFVQDLAAGADITTGTVVFDIWYFPITDDGALAGDDIDTELVAAIWTAATRTITALDEDSVTLDLDATIRAAVGLSSADLDAQLGALPTSAEVATAVLTTTMTESYNEDGVAPTAAQALMAILQILSESSVSGTTMTVKKVDGSTTAFTLTLNDALTPTGITRAT